MDQKTKEFYNEIADSWYNVRHWTIFKESLEELNKRWSPGKILNIGCAHGADFLPLDSNKFHFYGLDISKELLKNAKKYSEKFNLEFNLFVSDMEELPFKNKSFDYVISIATLHHLLKKEERIKTLKEIKRVLRKEAFLTVWNRGNPELPDKETIEKEWEYKGKVLSRPYYLYTKDELKGELGEAGFKIKEIKKDKKNKNIFALISPTK